MNTDQLIARVKNILLTPKTEWPVIAGETTSVDSLYKGYIAIVAAIPAMASFIKGSLIGTGAFGITIRTSLFSGLIGMVISYLLSLALVYVVALIIDALAPTFGGQKNPLQALKTIAYALTAGWVASIGLIVPWLGALIALAGGVYSIYLLYLGLPVTMQCPPEKAGGYTAVSVICAIVLNAIIAAAVSGITYPGSGLSLRSEGGTTTTFDQSTWLGKREAAQKSGNADAQSKAAEAMVSAALGGGNEKVTDHGYGK